jgi:hypothetical protein
MPIFYPIRNVGISATNWKVIYQNFFMKMLHGMMQGFTENYVRITAKYDPILINETKLVSCLPP